MHAQVPADGTVTVAVGGVAIGSQAVVPDPNLGSASITITRPIDGSVYGYGAQTGVHCPMTYWPVKSSRF